MKNKFPGLTKCLEMMRSKDAQTQEDGFHWLQPHASAYVAELIDEFDRERDWGLRLWLLELIAFSRSPEAFPFLAKHLRSSDWRCCKWAIIGLRNLDTKEARSLLWEARSFELKTDKDTQRLRKQLDDPHSSWVE